MDIDQKNRTVAEIKADKNKLMWVIVMLAAALLLVSIKLVFQSDKVILQTPGMPNNSVIEKNAMDKGAQKAVLLAVTSAITQINPTNVEYQKEFVQVFLSPKAYTKVSRDMDATAQKLANQRELGSYYFVMSGYLYDPILDRHYVIGDVHTVNAAKDTAEKWVFEYPMHIENYRPVIDDVLTYPGDKPHGSEWIKANKK